ncbi:MULTISPECIES: anti-sigma factor family protein [unclassified Amycolatopsis]|uniref:anti-sigma factor family protein n=1 Tax=unclassified Amycolatopsis TaxID=2618356 RepID=UPI002E15A897|nr:MULTISPECIES: zf-HC2 domain-containing protein [unclassified Amycolatopsis]WSJ81628.1 zf-HC2 domain-containing protein [Amycolatopsis sp. NBC_01307]WSK74994.1 zf-HC2 domain-containing protein [Amycolatopsis sp. NBC_01286]
MNRADAVTCRRLVGLLTAYLDEALSPRQHRRVREHLALCENCAAYLAQLRATIALTERRHAVRPGAPESLPAGLLDTVLDALHRR